MVMNRLKKYDVAIVGGGIAGISAAVGTSVEPEQSNINREEFLFRWRSNSFRVGAFCGFYTCGENPIRVVEGVGSLVLEEMKN